MSNVELTPRESQILAYIRQGWTNKAIAECLGVTINTVKAARAQHVREDGAADQAAGHSAADPHRAAEGARPTREAGDVLPGEAVSRWTVVRNHKQDFDDNMVYDVLDGPGETRVAQVWWSSRRRTAKCTRCSSPLRAMSGSCAHARAVLRFLGKVQA